MHEFGVIGVLQVFVLGVLFGIVVDRFVLWPLAVLIAKIDDRLRPG